MRELSSLILSAVAPRPIHGHGLIQAVADLPGGRSRLRAGPLYAALDRLQRQALVEIGGESVVGGRLRRRPGRTRVGIGDALGDLILGFGAHPAPADR